MYLTAAAGVPIDRCCVQLGHFPRITIIDDVSSTSLSLCSSSRPFKSVTLLVRLARRADSLTWARCLRAQEGIHSPVRSAEF